MQYAFACAGAYRPSNQDVNVGTSTPGRPISACLVESFAACWPYSVVLGATISLLVVDSFCMFWSVRTEIFLRLRQRRHDLGATDKSYEAAR